MSEFQYYEFQSINRRLTKEDREYLKSLSSRVDLETHTARFIYAYGDFRGDPLETLDRCFDMMYYIANFGVRQLAFRLPKDALDPETLSPYCISSEAIEVRPTEKSLILSIQLANEDLATGWIDEKQDALSPLLPLYDDLCNGDLRLLYLACCRLQTCEDIYDPQINENDKPFAVSPPAGLDQPSEALQEFMDFFNIDMDMVVGKQSG
ncbi:hypothetical protein [Geitlerinema sp. PCC 9228]|uniref:hypothetical protein n=1 Tax=Geitlerinema sp. PCC 9228 TaxID=111611 RepID=UPI000B0250F5|nr:hypothetical protein [Geitlerinema sp. PCC 9228]